MSDGSAWWDAHPLCGPFRTRADSEAMIAQRVRLYPDLYDLMPTDGVAGLDVLDFGCGPGHDTILFLEAGARHVYSADAAASSLEILEERLRLHGLDDGRSTLIHVEDGPEPDLPEFDYFHVAGALHHCASPSSVLRGLRRGDEAGRVSIYSAESDYYLRLGGTPEAFGSVADLRRDGTNPPVAVAWTDDEFFALAGESGFAAEKLGHYSYLGLDPVGLYACFLLVPA